MNTGLTRYSCPDNHAIGVLWHSRCTCAKCWCVTSFILCFYPYIHYYIHSDYSVTIGMANPKSGIGRLINYPVVLACMGNDKDLETKRLRDSHACIFSVHLVTWV